MAEDTIRKLRQEALIYQKIIDISTDGFLIVDDKGHIIGINAAYCQFLCKKKEDIMGKFVLDVISNSKLADILASGKTEVNAVHKLAEGQSPNKDKYVAVTRAAVKDGDRVVAAVGQIKFSSDTRQLAGKLQNMETELQYYKNELKRIVGGKYIFDTMIGKSQKLLETKGMAQRAAMNDFTVLLIGDTGTGKEVFANAIHYGSIRRNKPFIRVNCAAIPSELLESELFGYEEGAFTGAKRGGKAGKFELANGGTIFLDEIGDMPLSMQAKLLRVLQEREVERVGGQQPVAIDVRIIAATNQHIEENIKTGRFRADLYYRLNVIQLKIPPLKDRDGDVRLFADYFLRELNERYGMEVAFSLEAYNLLEDYGWPGNVRELRNVIERAYGMVDGLVILGIHLPAGILGAAKINAGTKVEANLESMVNDVEREIIWTFLRKNKNNCKLTAQELGIHRSTLYKKFAKLNIAIADLIRE